MKALVGSPTATLYRYINVVIAVNLWQTFTYKLVQSQAIEIGGIVQVSFAGRIVNAVVVAIDITPTYDLHKIKKVTRVICTKYFSDELFQVIQRAASYFMTNLGEAYFTALPPIYRNSKVTEVATTLHTFHFAPELQALLDQFGTGITEEVQAIATSTAEFITNYIHEQQVATKIQTNLELSPTSSNQSQTIDLANVEQQPVVAANIVTHELVSLATELLEQDAEIVITTEHKKALVAALKPYGLTLVHWNLIQNLAQYVFIFNCILKVLQTCQLLEPVATTTTKSVAKATKTNIQTAELVRDDNQPQVTKNEGNSKFLHDISYLVTAQVYDFIQALVAELPNINQNTKSYASLLALGWLQTPTLLVKLQQTPVTAYQSLPSQWFLAYQQLDTETCRQQLVNLDNKLQLNSAQLPVYNEVIQHQGFHAYLLDGVTGSGKTEVYLQLIEYYLLQGKSSLVLVPEIGLTPQTVSRFQNRFNVPIKIVHSNISDNEKNQIVQDCQAGKVAILIGTRSAVFLQLQQLGCIIIDEEHDQSYKQQNDFRYHARDIAILRANYLGIPIIMGTATPSFSTLRNVELGKFAYLKMATRAQALYETKTILINLRDQDYVGVADKATLLNKAGVSLALWDIMQRHLAQDNQVLLFLNRRGYAPQLACHDCGYIFICEQCDRPMTYHRISNDLHCHVCFDRKPIPETCPNCGSTNLGHLGAGTEQIEALMASQYDGSKIIRIDRDTTKNQLALEHNLQRIHHTKGAVLIGTQMLAKGHHFPDVTLVALLNIDGLVMGTDYRCDERLAQLYVQVAGRAGRESKQGTVVLQTSFPHEEIYHDLLSLSYFNFARKYLQKRQASLMPPYTYQAYLGVRAKDVNLVQAAIVLLTELIEQAMSTFYQQHPEAVNQVLYRTEAHDIGKQNHFYRFVLDFICTDRSVRGQVLTQVRAAFAQSEFMKKYKIIFYIDVDPYDLH